MRCNTFVLLAMTLLPGCDRGGADATHTLEATERKAETLEQNAAPSGNQKRPAASQMIGHGDARAVDSIGDGALDDTITCLARTIYWEARGEGGPEMEAVASVVMNRLGHEGFPDTICEVVMQGHEQGACQFSWWCDGRSDDANDEQSYAVAKEISRKALNRQSSDRTSGALYFHHNDVAPGWSEGYIKTTEIGVFAFYKPHGGDAR